MNANQQSNMRRLAKLFTSYSTAPSPQQLKQVLSDLEYKRFCQALGLYEVVKSTTTEQEKEQLCWADLPSDDDIHFFNNYNVFTI